MTICFHDHSTKIGEKKDGNLIYAEMKCDACGEVRLETIRFSSKRAAREYAAGLAALGDSEKVLLTDDTIYDHD